MILQLPREMLWTDFKTMGQFFELDPVNKDFCEVLMTLHDKPFDVRSEDVKVFNEVYYQLTRMLYERATPRDLAKYVEDIRGNMGWNYSVELVMTLLYFINALNKKIQWKLNRFLAITISEKYKQCSYWGPFNTCYNQIRRKKRFFYDFSPHPVSASELGNKYVHWQEITKDYETSAILEILSLWKDERDRKVLIKMIKASVNFNTPKLQKAYYDQIDALLKTNLFSSGTKKKESSDIERRINELDSKLLVLEKENAVFQNLTRELQADNARLKALLEENNIHGEARKFTLIEIVNYCKDCVKWEDAKDIVAMLNRLLLLNGCTPEDIKLVIGIETEFKNKKEGTTYIGQQTIIPNVGNYNAEVKTQNNNFPMPQIGGMEQKQITDE